MPLYSAYHLRIDSELPLPELPLLPASDGPAEVRVRIAAAPETGPEGAQQLGPYLWAGPREFLLQVPDVARYWIRDGRDIVIDPAPGADEDSLRVFLLGSGFGALLFQRGHLVLHGNAIEVDGRCLVCVGHSGAGKSTLAAEFLRRGHRLLADDVVPVDADCRALPGFPRIKLWKDTAQRLQIDTAALRRIRPGMEKFDFPVAPQSSGVAPLPLRWVYILRSHNEPDFRFEALQGMDRYLPLRAHTYRLSYLSGMGLKAEHLALAGRLAGRIRLVRVSRPDRGFRLAELADRILADIAANP